MVLADPALKNDFQATARLFKDYIHQSKELAGSRQMVHVAAIEQGYGPPSLSMAPPLRYYSPTEYKKLSANQK